MRPLSWLVFVFGSYFIVESYFWTGRDYRQSFHSISSFYEKGSDPDDINYIAATIRRRFIGVYSRNGRKSTRVFLLKTDSQYKSLLTDTEARAVEYLHHNLPIHAMGVLSRAILLCDREDSQLSRLHRLKAESYMLMNAPEDAIRELYRSALLIKPSGSRNLVLQALRPLLIKLFPFHAAIQSLDNIPITRNVNDLIFINNLDLTKLQFSPDAFEIAVKLQLATTLFLELLKSHAAATTSNKRQSMSTNRIMTPRRYRLGPGQDRHPLTIEADLRLTANTTAAHDILTNTHLDFDDKTGQYRVLAARDIQQGDVIFIEPPIVSLWSDVDNRYGCSHCWKPFSSHVSCSTCGEKYCSQSCRDQAQAEYHKVLCGNEWPEFVRNMDLANQQSATGSLFCLAVKVTAMALQQGIHPLHLSRFRNLIRKSDSSEPVVDDSDQVCESRFGNYAKTFSADFVAQCPNLVKKGIGHAGDVMEVADAIKMNVFGWNMDGLDYSALQHVVSLLNHHCDPSAQNRFNIEKHGIVSIIEALRDIKAGEEISISYIYTDLDYNARQSELINQFSFICRCSRCIAEAQSQIK